MTIVTEYPFALNEQRVLSNRMKNPAGQKIFAGFFCDKGGNKMDFRRGKLIPFLILSFFFLSCASTPPSRKEVSLTPEVQIKEIESSRQVKAMNERILLSALSSKLIFYSCKNNSLLLRIHRGALNVLGTTVGSLKDL